MNGVRSSGSLCGCGQCVRLDWITVTLTVAEGSSFMQQPKMAWMMEAMARGTANGDDKDGETGSGAWTGASFERFQSKQSRARERRAYYRAPSAPLYSTPPTPPPFPFFSTTRPRRS